MKKDFEEISKMVMNKDKYPYIMTIDYLDKVLPTYKKPPLMKIELYKFETKKQRRKHEHDEASSIE